MTRTTRRAHTHVELVRRKDPQRSATWFDVAAAYDAGMHFGVHDRQPARRELFERDAGIARLESMVKRDMREAGGGA